MRIEDHAFFFFFTTVYLFVIVLSRNLQKVTIKIESGLDFIHCRIPVLFVGMSLSTDM